MNIGNPQYTQGLIILTLENGESLKLTPRECWRLMEQARSFVLNNYADFDPPLVKVVQKNSKNFSVVITQSHWLWESLEQGAWEPNAFRVFDDFINDGSCYLDIGAWIGPTAFYAAQLAKRSYAFEPDPIAYRELAANLDTNRNAGWSSRLTIYNNAIASHAGTVKLGSRSHGGDSMSSLLFANENTSWEVQAITLEMFIEANNLWNEMLFIKMDIEGGEYELIPSIRKVLSQCHVDLFLSIHPHILRHRLMHGGKNNLRSIVHRTLVAFWHQFKLLRCLPFRHLYHINGQPVNFAAEAFKALVRGHFITEIVATNRKWNRR